MTLFYIGIFGLTGVFARHLTGNVIARLYLTSFPCGTLLINLSGSFLIGVIYVLGLERGAIPSEIRTGLMIGLLGGFTTFSSYCLETVKLIEEGNYSNALLYFSICPLMGLACVSCGMFLTRKFIGI